MSIFLDDIILTAHHLQIAIDSAIFPEGTSGHQLDVLARRALWRDGLNYMVRVPCSLGLDLFGLSSYSMEQGMVLAPF